MLERTIENYLKKRTEALGGVAVKLVGYIGIPDRLLLLPGGRALFAECKAPGGRPRPMQEHWLGRLEKLGFAARVVDSKEDVDELLDGKGSEK